MSDSRTNSNDIHPISQNNDVSKTDENLEDVLIINKEESDDFYEKFDKDCFEKCKNKKTLSAANRKIYKNCSKLCDLPRGKKFEANADILDRRQKQIDYGKNTIGYDKYIKSVPKDSRKKHHPKTPPKRLKCSRRAWDGLVKSWRQKLHFWDSMNS